MSGNERRRLEYAGSVHDEEEVEAVVGVLRGGASALRIGKNVRQMERLVADAFGKRLPELRCGRKAVAASESPNAAFAGFVLAATTFLF